MPQSNALSVSAALSIAKKQLEDITVKVVGEVSEVSINARYKAVYFTIKDEHASMPCMMWNNRYSACGIQLKVGALVEMTGRFTLYAAKGRMNFDVFSLSLAGEGNLRMKVANLAKKLEAEGLMAPEKKRAIPALPFRIGLVTSPRGAAVYDVLRTLRRRYPLAQIVFAGVGVEGKKAPEWIIEGLHAVEDAGVEVILLVRGGGSFEDLMPFNDEGLARTIASMSVPVVTGIGHEPDTSIADMVADFRASTPTAAAESVAPSAQELARALAALGMKAGNAMQRQLESAGSKLERLAASPLFCEPTRLFENEAQQLDELSARIVAAIPNSLSSSKTRLEVMQHSMEVGLSSLLARFRREEDSARQRFCSVGRKLMSPYSEKLAFEAACLNAYSPLAVLGRGYSIAKTDEGHIVKTVEAVKAGDNLDVQVSDGTIECKVEQTAKQIYLLGEFDG